MPATANQDTIIRYRYRRGDGTDGGRIHGPCYIAGADDGRVPEVQAADSCAKYGDILVSAERVARPAMYRDAEG